MSNFSDEQIIKAKDILWKNCDIEIIGAKSNRRDSYVRSVKEAHMSDILTAWVKLYSADKLPDVLIRACDLVFIPHGPDPCDNISLLDRMNKLEEKMNTMTELDKILR